MRTLLAALWLCASAAFTQSGGRIDGTVTDPTGAAVPGAEVTVTQPDTRQVFKTVSNEKGEFAIPSMPAAKFRVSVAKSGFKAGTVDGVEVNAGVPSTVNIELEYRNKNS